MAGSINYEVTKADYSAAMRLAVSPTKRRVIVVAALLVVGLFVATIAEYRGERLLNDLSRLLILAAPVFLATPYISLLFHILFRSRRDFSQFQRLSGPTELRWNDSGMNLKVAKGSVTYEWQDLVKFREGRQVFLLYSQWRLFHVLPKSAFDSTAALNDFKACLAVVRKE